MTASCFSTTLRECCNCPLSDSPSLDHHDAIWAIFSQFSLKNRWSARLLCSQNQPTAANKHGRNPRFPGTLEQNPGDSRRIQVSASTVSGSPGLYQMTFTLAPLASFCRETLEMGVFQGVRAYAEALEWLSWLRSGTDQEGKKVSRRVRGGRNRHKRRAANTRHQRHIGYQ